MQQNRWTKRSCAENAKCRAKQPESLHRFCWLHFCKEVLGSLLKVWHRTLMPGPGHAGGTSSNFLPEVARDWVICICFTGIRSVQSVHDPMCTDHQSKQSTSTEPPSFQCAPQHHCLPAGGLSCNAKLYDLKWMVWQCDIPERVAIGPSIPKCWQKTSKFGTGRKITIRRHRRPLRQVTSFDMFWHTAGNCFLNQCKTPRLLDGLVLKMLSIRYPELNPFSYSHQTSIFPTHIALTLATPQGSSSASQLRLLETCLGSVV